MSQRVRRCTSIQTALMKRDAGGSPKCVHYDTHTWGSKCQESYLCFFWLVGFADVQLVGGVWVAEGS